MTNVPTQVIAYQQVSKLITATRIPIFHGFQFQTQATELCIAHLGFLFAHFSVDSTSLICAWINLSKSSLREFPDEAAIFQHKASIEDDFVVG
jgi:hypothetical protein